jgi:hypothetical protein
MWLLPCLVSREGTFSFQTSEGQTVSHWHFAREVGKDVACVDLGRDVSIWALTPRGWAC